MMDDFLFRALIGGIGVALVAGPLGCFVAWRRMAYFGDALAHSALLGVVLGLALAVNVSVGILAVCVGMAALLVLLEGRRLLASDTLLGMLSHAALAFGLIAASMMQDVQVDLMSYLFGDILSISENDLLGIYIGGALVMAVLYKLWRPLLVLTISEELASAEGIRPQHTRLAYALLIAVVTAIGIRVVGVLLVTALLILPAAVARPFARTPEHMAWMAAAAGSVSVVVGLAASLRWDIPSGPAIVAAASALCLTASLMKRA